MKHLKHLLGTLLLTTLIFTSCEKDDDNDIIIRATAEDFNNLKDAALEDLTQTFQFDAADGSVNLTSENGVEIYINTNCLTLNGNAITGTIDLEFVEIFEKGNMLTTNKPTMGIMPNGDKALLLTGGEFFVEATKDGEALETNCGFQMFIPADLTGGVDNEMILWNGIIDEDGNLVWEEEKRDGAQGEGGVFAEGNNYYGFFQSFGWSNVDRFYNDPRDKTTILVGVPEGYDNTNSSVYISYDGEETGLAQLDTYDPATGLFSEHYGQIPIGLECHIIFATEENDNWKYAIKEVTIVENDIITFTENETSVVTEAQLTTIINDLP
ncbi:hypothetical protein APS56_09110 [Pseudalgibacter alginicilyticus]|uniref:Uncharacterized protein n=1 Tax=Pseudalgibacter alginicilyticus TaxID=1736674 RepID=A0A0N7HYH5_9FLAO|nr:hypothetical protein [Pseudalgibacter alginicilyticus]ALJ05270.1 hypothetical protein APS56_09110 [Pseudalgibacter alginicilyticus]